MGLGTVQDWARETPSASSEESFVQKVLGERSALLKQEKTARADAAFRDSLSPTARQACAIVDRIRNHEKRTVWTPQVEEDLATSTQQCIFPGMMFMTAKERMESTKLWEIVRRMPKGSLLHAHLDAMVEFDYLIRELLKLPGMHMASDRPLTSESAREDAGLKFRYRAADVTEGPSVWSDAYEPGRFVLLTHIADGFPPHDDGDGGGREAFIAWLKSRCTLSERDGHEHHHGVDAIWVKFAKCFMVVDTMIHYEPVYRILLRRLMANLMGDGVRWAELRFTWSLDYCRDQQETPEKDYTHMFQVLREEVARFKSTPEGRGFWGLTTIWTTHRGQPTPVVVDNMAHCIATKAAFPDLIAGYDLVGAEELGRPLVDLLPELSWFARKCEEAGVNLPFFFHAGETLGDGSSTDENLFDAIVLGTRRIGHGFSLYKHPLLTEMVKQKSILIESCPISNEVLRLCGSVLAHPLPALLARGVACSLCNDDPAMMGQDTAGMSHDFWQVLQGWDNLGLAGLGSLAENSITWSVFVDQNQAEWIEGVRGGSEGGGIKAVRLRKWRDDWEEFCRWIIQRFGDEFAADGGKEAAA